MAVAVAVAFRVGRGDLVVRLEKERVVLLVTDGKESEIENEDRGGEFLKSRKERGR